MKPVEALEADSGKLNHREASPTAASRMDRKFGPSGTMRYMVVLVNGSAKSGTVVEAATGDEAAEMALAKYPGQRVAYVGPANDGVDLNRLSDEVSE